MDRELLALAPRHPAQGGRPTLPRGQRRPVHGHAPEPGHERAAARWVLVHHRGPGRPGPRHQGFSGAPGLTRTWSATGFWVTSNEPWVEGGIGASAVTRPFVRLPGRLLGRGPLQDLSHITHLEPLSYSGLREQVRSPTIAGS